MLHVYHAIPAQNFDWVVYAFTLLVGYAPDALAFLQRRRGGGFGRGLRPRRRRRGGLFGALGTLALLLILGPVVLLLLVAYAFYQGMRRGR